MDTIPDPRRRQRRRLALKRNQRQTAVLRLDFFAPAPSDLGRNPPAFHILKGVRRGTRPKVSPDNSPGPLRFPPNLPAPEP